MIEMTYEDACNQNFNRAVNTLWNCPLDAKNAYRVHRVKIGIDKVIKEFLKVQETVAKKYAKLDDKGNYVFTPQGEFTFATEEAGKEFEAALRTEISDKKLVVNAHKIDFNDLLAVKNLPPAVIGALEPILANIPEDI